MAVRTAAAAAAAAATRKLAAAVALETGKVMAVAAVCGRRYLRQHRCRRRREWMRALRAARCNQRSSIRERGDGRRSAKGRRRSGRQKMSAYDPRPVECDCHLKADRTKADVREIRPTAAASPHHATPHHNTPHHAKPRHTTSHHTTPHHTTPHQTTPHHTTPLHSTPHHIQCLQLR